MDRFDQPSSLQSICNVSAASELFPKSEMIKEDPQLTVPFIPVCGEFVKYLGRTVQGILALSNYRLYHLLKETYYNIPLGLIEYLEVKENHFLNVFCKDGRILRCRFSSPQQRLEWHGRILQAVAPPKAIEDLFAFAFFAWSNEEAIADCRLGRDSPSNYFQNEVTRLQFDLLGAWRISNVNDDYKLCNTYPRQLLVPACVTDHSLKEAAKFRSSSRLPAIVWRHSGNGAVLARCGQPEVGLLCWRSEADENYMKAILDACACDRGSGSIDSDMMNGDSSHEAEVVSSAAVVSKKEKKILVLDARSFTVALANRARGGGCEYPEYYPDCEMVFQNLLNIHYVRDSFKNLRNVCAGGDQANWLTLLDRSQWLQNISLLMQSAVKVVAAIEREGRPVVVHCSDGWDRTPQIVGLAELLLDPYYRTIEGFQVLCEREWLDFGHKFAARCGHAVGSDESNDRCPVFIQWLDCVHQLLLQFPCSFQFSQAYLVKLAIHTYSNLFGTFLCNSAKERANQRVYERTFSVWKFLRAPNFFNYLYVQRNQVLWPSCNVRDLSLWTALYMGQTETTLVEEIEEVTSQPMLSKTRSYNDLMAAADHPGGSQRRSSDPSITIDAKFDGLNIEIECAQTSTNVLEDQGEESFEKKTDSVPNEENMHVNCNGMFNGKNVDDSEDDDNESTTESKSETTVCVNDKTVESSTDTLVASEMKSEFVVDPICRRQSGSVSGSTSRYSTPPLYACTPSSGFPITPSDDRLRCQIHEVDGIAPVQSEVQTRLQQIIAEHKAKEDALQRELHTTRLHLIHQVCNNNMDTPDDTGSLPESERGSLPSDVSWEAVEEREAGPTLWVPDHAVNRCMGCDTEFWLGRRKHHCRNCGKIFCADCSENAVPLPAEQLYDPVRVCTTCFAQLHTSNLARRRGNGMSLSGLPDLDNCKQASTAERGQDNKGPKPVVSGAST